MSRSDVVALFENIYFMSDLKIFVDCKNNVDVSDCFLLTRE